MTPICPESGAADGRSLRETEMQYEHASTDKDRFSLHDCRAASVELTGGRLVFRFPDGIFCSDYSKDWPNTGKAEVEFAVDPLRGVSLYLFVDSEGKTLREDLAIERLIEKINGHEWELEFAYRYDGYGEILYKCWVWENRAPWCCECELWIGTKEDAVFRWDSPAAAIGSRR